MATLDDLKIVLDSINTNISGQSSVLSNILVLQQGMAANQQRISQLGRSDRSASGSGGGNSGGGIGSRVGASLGAIGAGAAGAAGGIGALGLAMPAFFGGLLAGDMALGFLSTFGSGFDFKNLKAAAVGFTDIIQELDKEALIALGGLMGISAIGGIKAATGLGTMGFAISAFLGGLLAGDLVFSGISALGGDLKFDGMKAALTGFSDMIVGINPDSLKILGGILGLSALTGLIGKDSLGAAKALGAMGLGITGFLGGLILGDTLLSGVSALGGNIDFESLSTTLGGFSSAIDQLSPEAVVALAAIIGGSGVAAAFSKGSGIAGALATASIMTGIGAGIAGLMIGLTAGNAGIEWINNISGATGDGLVGAFKMFNDSIGELNNENAIIALGAIIAAGTAAGLLTNVGGVGAGIGIAAVMTGIGAGIAGLMIGLTTGDVALSWLGKLGSGDAGLVNAFKLFNDSILEITPEAIEAIKQLSSIGGFDITGALTGLAAGMVAFGTAEFIGSIAGAGAAIVGFFSGTESPFEQIRQIYQNSEELTQGADALDRLTGSLDKIGQLQFDGKKLRIKEFAEDLAESIPVIESAIMGGTIDNFGPFNDIMFKGLASTEVDYDTAIKNIVMLRQALSGVVSEDTMSGISTVNGAGSGGGAQQVNVNVDNSDNSVTNTSVKGGSNATTVNAFGSNRSDLDFLSRPSGAQ